MSNNNVQIDIPVAYEVRPSIQEEQYHYVGEVRIPILQIEQNQDENPRELYVSLLTKLCEIGICIGLIVALAYFL